MQTFKVEGMSCQHCVAAITRALQSQDRAAQVEVDLAAGVLRLNSDLPAEQVVRVLAEEDYAALCHRS